MRDLYPGYDVLAKRDTPSWNEQTRAVIEERLAINPETHRFFSDEEWPTLKAVCARIVPQPGDRSQPVPVAAMVDEKIHKGHGDGFRNAKLPRMDEAWRRGLKALDAEAKDAHGAGFHELPPDKQDQLLRLIEQGKATSDAWGEMPSSLFFKERILTDVVKSYYAHPTAWNEIGWGGPASPRGYVRVDVDRHDPWEAAEAKPGREEEAYRENVRVGR